MASHSDSAAELLEFPDGVRLAQIEEIPGPEPERSAAWERIKRAHISPGFTTTDSLADVRFRHYAEINVNASQLWAVFRDLCVELLGDPATLIAGGKDTEPNRIAEAEASKLLTALAPFRYQLAHDGFLQFGLVHDQAEEITEVLVTPSKHFKVWLNDIVLFRLIMERHELLERAEMEFIDQYPRTTTRLPDGRGVINNQDMLWKENGSLINDTSRVQ